MTVGPRLEGIRVYPLKSAAGISVGEAEVDRVGLRGDRRWMVVDEFGAFLSLRTHPRMALIRTALDDGHLVVEAPGVGALRLPSAAPRPEAPVRRLQVWREERYGVDCGAEAARWASDVLGVTCRIVRAVVPGDGREVTADGWVKAGFADAQPALVISTASLDELNRRLDEPLSMRRFRPNLVIGGVPAHAEDSWEAVRIGGVRARGLRPCPRCAATRVDPDTTEVGVEPLRTLAAYRRGEDGQVYFGMNARFEEAGVIRVGDEIVVEAGSAVASA